MLWYRVAAIGIILSVSVAQDVTVTIDADKVTHQINQLYLGCHSDSGYTHQPRGFYSQLIFGESFEETPPAAMRRTVSAPAALPSEQSLPSGTHSIVSANNSAIALRHCDFQLFATSGALNGDFSFNIVPALNKAPNSVSFQSSNFGSRYISSSKVDGTKVSEKVGRLGITEDYANQDAASFEVVPGLTGEEGTVSFKAHSTDSYIALNGEVSGLCASGYKLPSSDAVLTSSPIDKSLATWRLAAKPPAPPPPPAPYQPWEPVVDSEAQGNVTIDSTITFHGSNSLHLSYTSGSGFLGMSNRGLGREGLYLREVKEYEGYLYAKAEINPAEVAVALRNTETGEVLAKSTLIVPPTNTWERHTFLLMPGNNTECADGSSDPSVHCGGQGSGVPGHTCIKCMGEFVVGLESPGEVNVDYVFLSPGSWGRFGELPVLQQAVDNLRSMGVTSIRQGGSFTDPADYFWKRWRGKPWQRPSSGWEWGKSLISGWGPFEFVDMCNAAGIEPILTTSAQNDGCCSPEDMADLVEYCWGSADNTTWGMQRLADGHPEPYKVKIFELGKCVHSLTHLPTGSLSFAHSLTHSLTCWCDEKSGVNQGYLLGGRFAV